MISCNEASVLSQVLKSCKDYGHVQAALKTFDEENRIEEIDTNIAAEIVLSETFIQ